MPDFKATIAQLQQLGLTVEMYVEQSDVLTAFSADRVFISAEQVNDYAADPTGFLARHYGVTRQQYVGWCEVGGNVYCAADTGKGKRCRCVVKGMGHIPRPDAWAQQEAKGEYCVIHGGPGT